MELQKAEQKTRQLMQQHGLTDWKFQFNKRKMAFGTANTYTKTINLSEPLTILNTEEQVTDTILHEIAHALVGTENGHNHIWKQKARELGLKGDRCGEGELPPPNYIGVCPDCKTEVTAYRMGRAKQTSCCRPCYDKTKKYKQFIWRKAK